MFTKGPWDYVITDDGLAHISGHNWSMLARVVVWVDGEENKEGMANANLIAAAPDMYEALGWACDECDHELQSSCRNCPIDKVLAKSRGEENNGG